MQTESKQVPDRRTERLVVLQLLDGEQSLETLAQTLRDVDPDAIRAALPNLEAEEVAVAHDGRYRASRCAQHLNALDLICV